jgi:MFS family permease
MGRRYVALLGAAFVMVGMIVVGTAHRMDVAIGGMALAGVGAGLSELIAAAGVAELAPVVQRGKYIGIIFLLILPFSASAAYGIAYHFLSDSSATVCGVGDLAMGSMDHPHY